MRGKMDQEVLALSRAAKHIEELEDPRAQARVASYLAMRYTNSVEHALPAEDRRRFAEAGVPTDPAKEAADPRQMTLPGTVAPAPTPPATAPAPLPATPPAASAGTGAEGPAARHGGPVAETPDPSPEPAPEPAPEPVLKRRGRVMAKAAEPEISVNEDEEVEVEI